MMKRYLILCSLAISYLLSAELSVFDAGKLDSNSPYGLTESEKHILNTNNKLQNAINNIGSIQNQLNKLSEQQEGVTSVLDSISAKIASATKTIQTLESSSNDSIKQLEAELNELRAYVQESRELQIANQENVKKVLEELTKIVDVTNANYVSLEKRVTALENKKTADSQVITTNKQFSGISSDILLKDGEKLLSDKNYNKAKPYFQELTVRNYRPAKSNFALGEIAYFGENWSEAIVYYKKSAELYDKADYMPKLLYHTAISFDKIRDTANANQFYKLLKTNYPDTQEAKASPNRK